MQKHHCNNGHPAMLSFITHCKGMVSSTIVIGTNIVFEGSSLCMICCELRCVAQGADLANFQRYCSGMAASKVAHELEIHVWVRPKVEVLTATTNFSNLVS